METLFSIRPKLGVRKIPRNGNQRETGLSRQVSAGYCYITNHPKLSGSRQLCPNEPAIWAELQRVPHVCFTQYKEVRPVLFRSGSSLFLIAQSVSLLACLGSGRYFPNFRINTSFLRARRALHCPDPRKTSHILFRCKCCSCIMPSE